MCSAVRGLSGTHSKRAEAGVALLISIFALLLISAVAVALVVMSGTETAGANNYRNSTQAYYASLAGLEEARGRMWKGHPNSLYSIANFLPANNAVLPLGEVRYILNPSPGEVVQPANLAANNPYADFAYQAEFGVPVTAATVLTTVSVSNAAVANVPGPLFKWIRLTAVTEQTMGLDVDGNGVLDAATPVYYDGKNRNRTSTGKQVFRATALAVMPNGSRRLLQYDMSGLFLNLAFASALTFDGGGSALFPANSNVYTINGNDSGTYCGMPAQPARPAVGTVTPGDDAAITAAIPPLRWSKYTGSGPSPDVQDVSGSVAPNMQTVTSLENLVASITAAADQVIQGPATGLPYYGTPTAPTIAVVKGNYTDTGTVTGYGILVVTGNMDVSGTFGWRGPVLVIGQGSMTVGGGGNNSFEGALLLARTRGPDPTGTGIGPLLPGPQPGATTLDWSGGGGNGVHYDSCTLANAQNNVRFIVLSFREIAE